MIRTEGLTKRYGNMAALSELDLNISEGSVFGFVGPNGAGKTTAMSILATLLIPTEGKAFVGGFDVVKEPREVKQLIGYMPDFFGVYDDLKTTEYLDFFAAAYDIPKEKRPTLIRDLLDLVSLSQKADSYVDSLSRGMKQRLALARCLVHDPKVLILDEPASGLDPRARIEMKEIIKELRRMGKTILISSHILPELAEMCTDVGFIENGRLITVSSVDEMSALVHQANLLHIRLRDTGEEQMGLALGWLQDRTGVMDLRSEGRDLRMKFTGNEGQQAELLRDLVTAGIQVVRFSEEKADLEDLFLTITKGAGS